MLTLEFMYHAFAAAGIVALLTGFIGYFLLLRREAFAGHALSHIGFAGATGAGLLGISPFAGLLVFSLFAGGLIGFIGPQLRSVISSFLYPLRDTSYELVIRQYFCG